MPSEAAFSRSTGTRAARAATGEALAGPPAPDTAACAQAEAVGDDDSDSDDMAALDYQMLVAK